MDKGKLIRVWEYLALTGPTQYVDSESGLKDEFKPILSAGYCMALQHLAFALGLPVECEDLEGNEDSETLRRIRKEFPRTRL